MRYLTFVCKYRTFSDSLYLRLCRLSFILVKVAYLKQIVQLIF